MKRPWVIKAGGEMIADPTARKRILTDLKKLHQRHPVVFVHGGGPQIEAELKKQHLPARFVGGRRVTSLAAMIVVERVLSGEVNKEIAAQLAAKGVAALGLSCRDARLIVGKTIPNLGRAARPLTVNTIALSHLLGAGFLPVVSSVASDAKGAAININADDAASALAKALKASHLVFLTNISGVLDQKGRRMPFLKTRHLDHLIQSNVITGGMIPKVESARAAIRKGVGEVDIVNGRDGIRLSGGTRIHL